MEYGAIDLHKGKPGADHDGGWRSDRPSYRDDARSFDDALWGRPHARILIEASTESEWVAQHLEALGHEVVVADPNYTLMCGHRSRRVKTDRRDVAALAEACRHGIYRPAHRRSAQQRAVQWQLNIRRELVALAPAPSPSCARSRDHRVSYRRRGDGHVSAAGGGQSPGPRGDALASAQR